MSSDRDTQQPLAPEPLQNGITRREAVQRVTALLGGLALIGGSSLMAACERRSGEERAAATANGTGTFSAEEIAMLDEVADTILPTTAKSPGAKAAQTGAFMALMVTDTYEEKNQKAFRDGMRALDEASRKMHDATFMKSTPQQRLALLTALDKEAKAQSDARENKPGSPENKEKAAELADKQLSDQRQENATSPEAGAGGAAAVTEDKAPPHYFRMMKELAMLGYFTSEIGYTKAMRYVESPGRYDPCAPYAPGEKAWAPHA